MTRSNLHRDHAVTRSNLRRDHAVTPQSCAVTRPILHCDRIKPAPWRAEPAKRDEPALRAACRAACAARPPTPTHNIPPPSEGTAPPPGRTGHSMLGSGAARSTERGPAAVPCRPRPATAGAGALSSARDTVLTREGRNGRRIGVGMGCMRTHTAGGEARQRADGHGRALSHHRWCRRNLHRCLFPSLLVRGAKEIGSDGGSCVSFHRPAHTGMGCAVTRTGVPRTRAVTRTGARAHKHTHTMAHQKSEADER